MLLAWRHLRYQIAPDINIILWCQDLELIRNNGSSTRRFRVQVAAIVSLVLLIDYLDGFWAFLSNLWMHSDFTWIKYNVFSLSQHLIVLVLHVLLNHSSNVIAVWGLMGEFFYSDGVICLLTMLHLVLVLECLPLQEIVLI